MTYEEFCEALKQCGCTLPSDGAVFTRNLLSVHSRMMIDMGVFERVNCRRQVEQFAKRYVAENKESPGAKSQGWAILQAAYDLTSVEPK